MDIHVRARRAGLRLAALAVGAAAVAACSSSTTTSSPNTTGSPAAHSPTTSSPAASPTSGSPASATCKHVSSLRSSLTSLTHLSLSANSASQIRTDVANIETQLAALKGQVTGPFKTQLDQLHAAVGQVTSAAAKLGSPPTAAQIQAITGALTNLKTKSASAISAMNAACPG